MAYTLEIKRWKKNKKKRLDKIKCIAKFQS